jgi:hypothetical protein
MAKTVPRQRVSTTLNSWTIASTASTRQIILAGREFPQTLSKPAKLLSALSPETSIVRPLFTEHFSLPQLPATRTLWRAKAHRLFESL